MMTAGWYWPKVVMADVDGKRQHDAEGQQVRKSGPDLLARSGYLTLPSSPTAD